MQSDDLNDRQAAILGVLRRDGEAQVEDLAEKLRTTPQTIRKDLKVLVQAGQAVRFHGGVRLRPGRTYLDIDARGRVAAREKRLIGAAAAERLPQGATVFINAGTTTEAAARAMRPALRLTVITDNVHTADILRQRVDTNVIICGGPVRSSDGAVVGAAAVGFLEQFEADIALISAAALSADGILMDYDLDQVAVARTMIARAREVLILMDSHKFDARAPVRIGPIPRGATLITDHCPSVSLAAACRRNGASILDLSQDTTANPAEPFA